MKNLNSSIKAGPIGAATIGNFDGLHLGHQKLISTTVECAQKEGLPSLLYTFKPHPVMYLFPERKQKLISSYQQGREILQNTPLNHLVFKPFTKAFADIKPRDFLEQFILKPFSPRWLVVGHDFRFGANRKGSLSLLKQMAKIKGFRLKVLPPVKQGGEVISSSLIKKCILLGKWDRVPKLLGRLFCIRGRVVKGEGRGKKLGYPTLNLQVPGDVILPKNGVYSAYVKDGLGCKTGPQRLLAVVNIGTNPTFVKNPLKKTKKIEVHIIDNPLNLGAGHGPLKNLEVEIINWLRAEKAFANPKDLSHQIQQDINLACSKCTGSKNQF